MLAAFLLGLTASVGHCVGMCSGVSLVLARKSGAVGWELLLLHLGRLSTYAGLGLVAGGLGSALAAIGGPAPGHAGHHQAASAAPVLPALAPWQGGLALLAAAAAFYMAVALLGRAPSPELLLAGVARWWGRALRQDYKKFNFSKKLNFWNAGNSALLHGAGRLATIYALGLLWGLLPCGLVLAALVMAAVAGSPAGGALTMLAFGLGTGPVGLTLSLFSRQGLRILETGRAWLRPMAAVVVLLFGAQMTLRGLALWGWVEHAHLGGLMLW